MTELRAGLFGLSEEESAFLFWLFLACVGIMGVCSAIDGRIRRNRERRRRDEEAQRRDAISKAHIVPVGPDDNLNVTKPTEEEAAQYVSIVRLAEMVAAEYEAHETDQLDAGGRRL